MRNILLSLVIATVIIIPVEAWAEEDYKWDELRAWKQVKDNTIPILIVRDANVSEKQVDLVEYTINSKETTNSEKKLFQGWNEKDIRVNSVGSYRVYASFEYNGKKIEGEREFKVEEPVVAESSQTESFLNQVVNFVKDVFNAG